MSLRLLALAASLRPASLNRMLLQSAVREATEAGASVQPLDYAQLQAPLCHGEDQGPLPPGPAAMADALLSASGLLLASPEYNWSMPAALKNLIDWLSLDPRAPLRGKTVLLMSASQSVRGGVSGLLQLRVPLEVLGMWVYPQIITVGQARSTLTADGLSQPKDAAFLRKQVREFIASTQRIAGV